MISNDHTLLNISAYYIEDFVIVRYVATSDVWVVNYEVIKNG